MKKIVVFSLVSALCAGCFYSNSWAKDHPEKFYYPPEVYEKMGYKLDGDTILAPIYNEGGEFNHGMAPVSKDGEWFFIDTEGEKVIPQTFNLATSFQDTAAYALFGSDVYVITIDKEIYPRCPDVSPDIDEQDLLEQDIKVEDEKKSPKKSVENEPEFLGSNNGIHEFLRDRIQYPKKARKEVIEGRVIVKFVVETDGCISSFEIIDSSSEDNTEVLYDAALLALIQMPNWKPGKQDGEAVRVKVYLPINFQLGG